MNEETFGEAILRTVVLVTVALVIALMVMASMGVHFRLPDPPPKHKQSPVEVVVPKEHQKQGSAGQGSGGQGSASQGSAGQGSGDRAGSE